MTAFHALGDREPLVSVVIPALNAEAGLRAQLEAVTKQYLQAPFEVVVADNGSTDQTVAVVREFQLGQIPVRVIDASAKRGAGAARNAGVRASRGTIVAHCDADDITLPGWLHRLVTALEEGDLAGGQLLTSLLRDPLAKQSEYFVAFDVAEPALGFLPYAPGGNMAYKRLAWEQAGGFEEEEFLIGEDVSFCWRMQLRGARFVPAPKALVAVRPRTMLRDVWNQSEARGRSSAALYTRYRFAGAKRRPVLQAARAWAWIVINLPRLLTRATRRRWVAALAINVGRVRGGLECRKLYW